MPRAPQQTSLVTAEDHAAEVEQQERIAAELAPESAPDLAATEVPVAEEVPAPVVTLVPAADAVIAYPLRVSLVGLEDEIVFEDENASVEVAPPVAEQVRYLSNVEVAA